MAKRLTLFIATVFVSFLSSSVFAFTPRSSYYFVGVDFQNRILKFDNNVGVDLFNEHSFQYDLYGGMRFLRYWGIDMGYFADKNKNQTVDIGSETHFTETKIKGPHVDLLTFSPLFPEYGIELIAGAGVSYSKLMLKDAIVVLNNVSQTSPVSRTYDIKKATPRALIGIQTLLLAAVGVRATLTWENTSVFNDLKPDEIPNDTRTVSARNSWIYGVGFFVIA